MQKKIGNGWNKCKNLVDSPVEFEYPNKKLLINLTYEGRPFAPERFIVKLNGVLLQDLPKRPQALWYLKGIFKSSHETHNDGILHREVFLLIIDGSKVPIVMMHNKRNQLLQIDAENKPVKSFEGIKLDDEGDIEELQQRILPYVFTCKDKKMSLNINQEDERFTLQVEGKNFDDFTFCDESHRK